MDDPLSLLMQGVWLMAAGMYPLGFLFGACSACCDECPDECNKCAGYYHYDANWPSPCNDTFDSLEIESPINSVSVLNVTPDGNNRVNISVNILEITCPFTPLEFCEDMPNPPEIDLTFSLLGSFFESEAIVDECGCPKCNYIPRLSLRVDGSYDPGRGDGGDPCGFSFGDFPDCLEGLTPQILFDKCAQKEATANITITREDLESCAFGNLGIECDLPDSIEVSVTLALDVECECGACCRNSSCSQNESESYCEDGGNFSIEGLGVWQGVGTDCDPNPCEEE